MSERLPVVFLVDVDNTLLDNDHIQNDLRGHLEREFGAACRDRYWKEAVAAYPPADVTVERIGDLLSCEPLVFKPSRKVFSA